MAAPGEDHEPLRSLADRARFNAWTIDKLRLADIDHQGHVNNAVHPVLLTNGRYEFMQRHLRPHMAQTDIFAMVKITIEYLNEMHYPGEVETGTLVRRVGRSSITFGQAMFEDGRCVAVSESIMVLLDATTRRAKPWPPEVAALLTGFAEVPVPG